MLPRESVDRRTALPEALASAPGVLLSGGYGDREARALARCALHPHRGPHALRKVLHDGETEAGAPQLPAAGFVNPVEALENPGQMLGRDAGAVIADLQNRASVGAGRARHLDVRTLGRVLDRVLHQVLEDAPEAIGIGHDGGHGMVGAPEREL